MHGKSSESEKTTKKLFFGAVTGGNKVEKLRPSKSTSRNPTKCTYLISASLLNLEGSYARNKTQKKTTKKPLLEVVESWKGTEKSRPPKGTSGATTKWTYQISTSLPNLEGRWGRNGTFWGPKRGKSPYLTSQLTWRVDFVICYTTFDFLSIGLKTAILRFWALSNPAHKLGHSWILIQKSWNPGRDI